MTCTQLKSCKYIKVPENTKIRGRSASASPAAAINFSGRFANLISPSVPHYGGSSLHTSYLASQPCSRCGRRLTRPIRSFDSAFLEFSKSAAVSAARITRLCRWSAYYQHNIKMFRNRFIRTFRGKKRSRNVRLKRYLYISIFYAARFVRNEIKK